MSSTISEFYEGKHLLIFGSTTFTGKVLLEKLLRSCPDLEKIYCPIQSKDYSPVDTFEEIYTTKLFDRVRRLNPKFHEKILPFDQKILSSPEEHAFRAKIDLCFYIANNSVDFQEENLQEMLDINIVDLKANLSFLKTCSQLKSLVYLSSIYANIDCPYIDECIYPCSIEPEKLLDALDWMDKEMLALATPKLIGPKPNAFTFTHWLAETVLASERNLLPPISIVRASIIGAAWKEPYPGWVEKSNGPSELFVAAGRGYLRSMKGDSEDILDIIPVDIPVNLLIASLWGRSMEETSSKEIRIYHCTSSGLNPFRWQEMSSYLTEYSKRIPYEHAFRRPNLTVTNHSLIHDSYVFFSHLIPAYLTDFGLRLLGREAHVVNLYKNLHRILLSLETFSHRGEIQCSYDSLNSLKQLVNESNHSAEFSFDIRVLHWPTYIESYLIGTKRYVLNENMNCLSDAQKHLNNLRNIRWIFNTTLLVLLWRIFISKRPTARNLWYFIINFFVAKFVRFFKIFSAGNN